MQPGSVRGFNLVVRHGESGVASQVCDSDDGHPSNMQVHECYAMAMKI